MGGQDESQPSVDYFQLNLLIPINYEPCLDVIHERATQNSKTFLNFMNTYPSNYKDFVTFIKHSTTYDNVNLFVKILDIMLVCLKDPIGKKFILKIRCKTYKFKQILNSLT